MLRDDMGEFFYDPLGWLMYAFPWDSDPSIQIVELCEPYASRYGLKYGPDKWVCELFEEWGKHIRSNDFNGKKAVDAFRQAVSSGHGIGKSATTAFIILYIISTRPHSKGVVTSNTNAQLRTKTWAELGKWLKKCVTRHWFDYRASTGNMSLKHVDYPESWRCDAFSCKEENSESFAGLHAAVSSPYYIFDEASAVPDKIWEVAEGGMTDGEPFWFAFGNPTRNTGRFRECARKFRHRWNFLTVDSRKVQITNKDKIQEWLDDYGEDSDFFKIRVRGIFPSQSSKQYIPESLVDAARGKHLHEKQYSFAPIVITCDPAWEGDDELVIGKMQGLWFEILDTMPKNDNDIFVAQKIARYEDDFNADAVNVDLGYGTGIVSAGRAMGRDWNLINFASASPDVGCINMRAYMYKQGLEWLQSGGAMPDDDMLCYEACQAETVPRVDGKIQIESKKDMKKRGLNSGNRFDALILGLALPVTKKEKDYRGKNDVCEMEYDVLG